MSFDMSLEMSDRSDYKDNSLIMNSSLNIDKLRLILKECIERQQYRSAIFWSDKIVSLSDSSVNDVYLQAICFYNCKEYHRSAHSIKSRNLHKTVLSCRHLAAKCHVINTSLNQTIHSLNHSFIY
jgi:anaphase-promoting complex subunit 6